MVDPVSAGLIFLAGVGGKALYDWLTSSSDEQASAQTTTPPAPQPAQTSDIPDEELEQTKIALQKAKVELVGVKLQIAALTEQIKSLTQESKSSVDKKTIQQLQKEVDFLLRRLSDQQDAAVAAEQAKHEEHQRANGVQMDLDNALFRLDGLELKLKARDNALIVADEKYKAMSRELQDLKNEFEAYKKEKEQQIATLRSLRTLQPLAIEGSISASQTNNRPSAFRPYGATVSS